MKFMSAKEAKEIHAIVDTILGPEGEGYRSSQFYVESRRRGWVEIDRCTCEKQKRYYLGQQSTHEWYCGWVMPIHFAKRIHPYDGTKRAGEPEGPAVAVIHISAHEPKDGPSESMAICHLGDGTWEFEWNLVEVEI